jgi:hypothetical protein
VQGQPRRPGAANQVRSGKPLAPACPGTGTGQVGRFFTMTLDK